MGVAMIVRANFTAPAKSMAEVVRDLGDIPLERIFVNPPIGTATENDLIALLDGEPKRVCELVDGVLVEKALGAPEALLAGYLLRKIGDFAEDHDRGVVLGADGPYQLNIGLVRLPDVSFIPWQRLPNDELPGDAVCRAIPTLAVEVLSPKNTKAEIDRKLGEYFTAGVKVTWVIDPKTHTAKVYSSAKRFKVIDATGALDGGRILPGFKLPLASVFAATRRRKKK